MPQIRVFCLNMDSSYVGLAHGGIGPPRTARRRRRTPRRQFILIIREHRERKNNEENGLTFTINP